ncbi:g4256 [Coccomyxa viridis]|uniref:G4256 protein n=1 Tax=Coccomyxa viridis TaxID=1274662 RepID=A0ABP1FT07_9CHLO
MAAPKGAYQALPAAEAQMQTPFNGKTAVERSEKGAVASSPSGRCAIFSQALIGTLYVALWISLSGAVIMYNKWILVYYGFPFPITLTMWHMAFSAVLATIAVKAGWVRSEKSMSATIYWRSIVPVAVLFAGTLWLGNSVYMYLSVAFIQMLKALMPVAVFATGCIFGIEKFKFTTLANMVIVTVGVAIASYGELKLVVLGVILQLAAVATESTRLILVQILLQRKGLKLNPFLTMYYIAPASFGVLSILWIFVEREAVMAHHFDSSLWWVLLSNGIIAFGLNLSVFLLIGKTSALTMNVAGVIKDWLLIGLSALMFQAQISGLSLGGYGVAFSGVCWYNYTKLQAMQAKQAQLAQQPTSPLKKEGLKDPRVSP